MPLVCTQGNCDEGDLLVAQMQAYWKRFAIDEERGEDFAADFRERFSTATTVLVEQYNEISASWQYPFDPDCCKIQELGRQAYELTKRMSAMADVESPSDPKLPAPGEDTSIGDLLKYAVVGGIIIAAIVAAPHVIEAVKGLRS